MPCSSREVWGAHRPHAATKTTVARNVQMTPRRYFAENLRMKLDASARPAAIRRREKIPACCPGAPMRAEASADLPV
ncbi:MAG: hypothetical protein PVSMB4_01890 [Ktedonobacterales bacterium]